MAQVRPTGAVVSAPGAQEVVREQVELRVWSGCGPGGPGGGAQAAGTAPLWGRERERGERK